jgi:hypothetical protein
VPPLLAGVAASPNRSSSWSSAVCMYMRAPGMAEQLIEPHALSADVPFAAIESMLLVSPVLQKGSALGPTRLAA